MSIYYYRAYDGVGHKHSGKIDAYDQHAAETSLHHKGLHPYFVREYQKLKKEILKKRKRHRILMGSGVAISIAAFVGSGLMVRYAGREQAPPVEAYVQAGILEGATSAIYGKSAEERAFAGDIFEVWQSFTDEAVTGIEVTKLMMIVYVSRKIRKMEEGELEMLASNTVRALQRRFKRTACTLLVVQDNSTILETKYNAYTRNTHTKRFR